MTKELAEKPEDYRPLELLNKIEKRSESAPAIGNILGVLAVAQEPITIAQIANFANNPPTEEEPKAGFIAAVDEEAVKAVIQTILDLERESGVQILEKSKEVDSQEGSQAAIQLASYRFNQRFREVFESKYPELCKQFNGLIADFYLKLMDWDDF